MAERSRAYVYMIAKYSVDSIKRTVLLKVLFGTVSIKRTVFNSDFKKNLY